MASPMAAAGAARVKHDELAISKSKCLSMGKKRWTRLGEKEKEKKEKMLHCLATEAKEKRRLLVESHSAAAPERRKNAETAIKAKEVLQRVNQDAEILAAALRRHLNAVSAHERVIAANAKATKHMEEARAKITQMEKKMKDA